MHLDPRQAPYHSLRTLMTSLREAGLVPHSSEETDDEIQAALAESKAVENRLSKDLEPKVGTRYWALHYNDENQAWLWNHIEPIWKTRWEVMNDHYRQIPSTAVSSIIVCTCEFYVTERSFVVYRHHTHRECVLQNHRPHAIDNSADLTQHIQLPKYEPCS